VGALYGQRSGQEQPTDPVAADAEASHRGPQQQQQSIALPAPRFDPTVLVRFLWFQRIPQCSGLNIGEKLDWSLISFNACIPALFILKEDKSGISNACHSFHG
jgi:hypothetical protein